MMESRKPKHVDEVETDPNVKAAIQEMERVLGTKVRIVEKAKQKGQIEIEYYSAEDLDRIYSAIVGESVSLLQHLAGFPPALCGFRVTDPR